MTARGWRNSHGGAEHAGRAVWAAAGAVLVLLAACTGAPPEVTRARAELVYVDDLDVNAVYESLIIDVHVQDADGIDDVETIHVAHDASGLVWTVPRGEWVVRREAGAEVFALAGLATPDGRPLPRGRYRVIAVDAAGHAAEHATTVAGTAPEPGELRFPRLEIRGDTLSASGGFPLVVVRGYGTDGRLAGELRLSDGEERSVSEFSWLGQEDRDVELVVSAIDPETGLEVMRGPY
ncbi:MAG: hypothetical protein ACLFNX_03735 [Spirochaetaceae bacterium]